jgi:hypothetical protein
VTLVLGALGGVAALLAVALVVVFGGSSATTNPDGGEGSEVAGGGEAGGGEAGGGPGGEVEVVSPPASHGERIQRLLADLQNAQDSIASTEEVAAFRREFESLEGAPLEPQQRLMLQGARWRLEALERDGAGGDAGGADATPPASASGQSEEGRAARAWEQICATFERILYKAIETKSGGFNAGAEYELGSVRQDMLQELYEAESKPDALLELIVDPRWVGLLGRTGVAAFVQVGDRCPRSLRRGPEWERWLKTRAKLVALYQLADRYERWLWSAWVAYQRGDLAAARKAPEGADKGNPWGNALARYLLRDEVARAFTARKGGGALPGGEAPSVGGDPGASPGGGVSSVPPPLASGPSGIGSAPSTRAGGGVALQGDWRTRFLAADKAYRTTEKSAREPLVRDLLAAVGEAEAAAGADHEACIDIVALFEEHPRAFVNEERLKARLDVIHALYFEAAFARCSGPHTFKRLDEWCERHGHDAWRERIAPWLKTVNTATGAGFKARGKARAKRAKAIQAVRDFNRRRVRAVVDGLDQLLAWMAGEGFASPEAKAQLATLIGRAVERAGDPLAAARLNADLNLIEHRVAGKAAAKVQKAFGRQYKKMIEDVVDDSLTATERALKVGEAGLAFDLFQYVLRLDPDNARANKGLGHVKVDGRWLRPFRAAQLRRGIEWDSQLGWVKQSDRARYDAGEVFDRSWKPLAEANRDHADAGNPWVIVTEHFELRTTCDLRQAVWLSERLEAYYLQIFRQYDRFFATKGGAKLIFGVSPLQKAPLVVNIYRDRNQYLQFGGGIAGSAGFYSPSKHASFFYDQGEDVSTLQHEVTHQILGEASPDGAFAWVGEGAAVYLQYASLRDGVLTLGRLEDNPRVYDYARNQEQEHSLSRVLNMESQAAWNAGLSSANYRSAGAAVYFFCNFDGGRYRGDFVEMMRHNYLGRPVKVENYFNLPKPLLEKLMKRFYAGRVR